MPRRKPGRAAGRPTQRRTTLRLLSATRLATRSTAGATRYSPEACREPAGYFVPVIAHIVLTPWEYMHVVDSATATNFGAGRLESLLSHSYRTRSAAPTKEAYLSRAGDSLQGAVRRCQQRRTRPETRWTDGVSGPRTRPTGLATARRMLFTVQMLRC